MNRYLLFGGTTYSAKGGFKDFAGDYDNLKKAFKEAEKQFKWYHIG